MGLLTPGLIIGRKTKPSLSSWLPIAGIIILHASLLLIFIAENLQGKSMTGFFGFIFFITSPVIGLGALVLQLDYFIRKKKNSEPAIRGSSPT